MGTADEIDDATIAIDEATTLEIKAIIWPTRVFRNYRLTYKFYSVNHPLFSSRMSL